MQWCFWPFFSTIKQVKFDHYLILLNIIRKHIERKVPYFAWTFNDHRRFKMNGRVILTLHWLGPQGPHERLLPLRNWTEKRFIFSNTGVHSGDKSGNRISRNVWPFEKLRVENWQICLNTTGRIFIILPRLMVILPALFDFSRPWRFISAQKSYWTLHFCHTLMLLEEK